MAEVDTSIYPKAAPPTNPLTMLGQFAGAQNALNTNRLFQQEFSDRAALNDAYSGAFDPATGQIDTNMLTRGLAGSGAGRLLPEALTKAQEYKASAAKASVAEIESYKAHTAIAGDALTPLLLDDKSTQDDAIKAIRQVLVQHPQGQNGFTPKWAGDILGTMPNNPQDPNNQAKFRVWLKQLAVRNAGAAAQLNAGAGENILVNNGQSLIPMHRESAIAGGATSGPTGAPIQTFPSRGELAARVAGPPDQSGAPTTAPLGSVTPPNLGGPAVTGGIPVRPAAPAAVAPTAPSAVARPAVAAAASAPPAATGGALPGQITTALPPGQAEAAQVAGRGSGEGLNAERSAAGNYDARNNQAKTALTALQSTKTGPGTEGRNAVQSYLMSFPYVGAGLRKIGLDPTKDVAAYDEAVKLLAKNALDQSSTVGANSDAGRALAQVANASTHISNAAAQTVVKMNIGLDRMQTAAVRAFDETGLPESQYAKWKIDWLKGQDPRAYTADLSPGEAKKIHDGLTTDAEKRAFQRSLANAVEFGFIPPKGSK